jgi:DNA-binding IclR family transcriptional regulator
MAPISPPISRAVSLLNFLAQHPEHAFTLSEISKSLHISSATCHTLLAALTDAGYIYRTVGKTYVLGPALVRVAHAASAPALTMQVARPEMRLLADEFDVVCSASFLVADEIIVRERASSLSHLNWHKQSIHAIRLAPPVGGILLSPTEAAFQSWLEEQAGSLGTAEKEQILESRAFLKAHGFAFGVRKIPLLDPKQARELQNQEGLTEHELSKLEKDVAYNLAYIVAPVFSAPDAIAFLLSLTGFSEPTSGQAVEHMGARLRAACDRIGSFMAGRDLP